MGSKHISFKTYLQSFRVSSSSQDITTQDRHNTRRVQHVSTHHRIKSLPLTPSPHGREKQRDSRRDNKIRPSRCMPPPHLPDNNAENTHGPSQRPPPSGPTTQEPVVFGDFARKPFSLSFAGWRAYVRALLTVFFLALLH